MARPSRSDPVAAGLGAALGAGVGGPVGAALGGLIGASMGASKYTLEAALEKLLQERDLESRAIRWVTKRAIEVAFSSPGGPLRVARIASDPTLMDPEAIADALYDTFLAGLNQG